MEPALRTVARSFPQRVAAPRGWTSIALKAPRIPLALVLASLPLLLAGLVALVAPQAMKEAAVLHENVREVFSRSLGAVITASSIAVSVATLTIRRKLRGVEDHEKHRDADKRYRSRVQQRSGRDDVPLEVGRFLAVALLNVAEGAREARRAAGEAAQNARTPEQGLPLADLLDTLEARAERVAKELDRVGRHPEKSLEAALDFETETTSHLVGFFSREESLPAEARAALHELEERIGDFNIGQRYLKTLATQWGLSRMSSFILLTTLPALLVGAGTALTWGRGAQEALGLEGAILLLGVSYSVMVLPLAAFVSYVLQFVFVNQYTLPTEGFTLGLEAVSDRGQARREARRSRST